MMLFAPITAELEVRKSRGGGRRLTGKFPYNKLATLSDGGRRGGRPRKERFKSHAFRYRVKQADADIHLLVGHDYNFPLASKLRGTLDLDDTVEALLFDAEIAPAILELEYVQRTLALISSGLAVGISPGFRIPPQRTVANAEEITEEDPSEGNALIRTISEALLFELSIVTLPAYKESDVEARCWTPDHAVLAPRRMVLLP